MSRSAVTWVRSAGLIVVAFAVSVSSFCSAADTHDQPLQQNDGPKTLQRIEVVGQYDPLPQVSSLGALSYGESGGYFRYGFAGGSHATTTNPKEDQNGCPDRQGEPIEVSYGSKEESQTLFALPGEMGLKYVLNYSSMTGATTDNLGYDLNLDCNGRDGLCTFVTFTRPDGSSLTFSGNPKLKYGGFPEAGGDGVATLNHNSDGSWTLHDENATTQTYVSTDGVDALLTSIKDASGVGWTIARSGEFPSPTSATISHTDGQHFTVTYAADTVGGKITGYTSTVTDPAGNIYTLQMNPYGNLTSEALPGSPQTVITFVYDSSETRLVEMEYNGTPYSYTTYSTAGLATGTHLADASDATSIVYSYPSSGTMTATITNPLGHRSVNQYASVNGADGNPYYQLASTSNDAVQDCGATVQTQSYDSNGYLAKVVDNDGITHTYSYAATGQLQAETEGYGTAVARTTNYTWDTNTQLNRQLSVTVPGESKISYTYNAQNRIASVTRTNLTGIGTANESLITTYTYALYGDGMVQTMTVTQPSPGGSDHVTYAYDAYGNLTSVTDGLGHVTSYSNYNGLGEAGKVVGPNGDETDYTWDARGRVGSKTTHPNGTTATWTYAYDGFGLLSQLSAPDGEVTTWSRDAEKRVTAITHNDKDGTSTETFAYDANNDVTSDVIARGSDIGKSTSYAYDALGRVYQVKGSHGQVLTYDYDGNGNVLSITDALGHTTRYAYDALNRVSSTTDAAGAVTSYAYDAGDHVTRVTDPRNLVTGYSWDGLGQLWQQQSPDTGTTSFSYDTNGRLASKTRADGTQITYGYDALNRVVSQAAGGITRSYTWDVCTNGKGRLCAASNQGYDSVGYSYSPEGWITGRSFSISGGPSYGLGYAYDNVGHLAVVDYPDGNEALYDYINGVVADVRLDVGGSTVNGATGATYLPMDLAMNSWTSSNGLSNSIGYDSDARPTSIGVPGVESLAFTYDSANRITQLQNGLNGAMTETLGYDAVNRLNSVASSADNESYLYDADGNRTSQTINGTVTTFGYPGTSNRLASMVSSTYNDAWTSDAEGDLTAVNGHTVYQYNAFGRLINVNGTGYAISAEGQRLSKTGTGLLDYFAPGTAGELEAEDLNGTWQDYVWLNGRLAGVIRGGAVYAAHADQTGRPQALTDASKAVVWASQNLPFGSTVTSNSWGSFNLGFPGQYHDTENSGLWQNGFRDYDPYTGRYIESDPIGLAGGVNTYAYVGNNPISSVDPYGLYTFQIGISFGYSISIPGTGIGFSGVAGIGAAFDTHGGIAPYAYYGAGASGGTSGADGGVQVAVSNADTVQDLAGPFKNFSANGGIGEGGAADAFWGKNHTGCKDVKGAGLTIGGGAGAYIFGGVTNTLIGPSGSLW